MRLNSISSPGIAAMKSAEQVFAPMCRRCLVLERPACWLIASDNHAMPSKMVTAFLLALMPGGIYMLQSWVAVFSPPGV